MVDAPAVDGERTILASPFPAAAGRVLVSPFQFLVTGEDNLRIEGWSSASGVTLVVVYRFADTKGRIVANDVRLPLTGDRLGAELDVKLGEGYLVNLSVFTSGGAPGTGQVFTCVKLIRGFTGATMVLGLLAQGYVTNEQGLGWPGSPIESSLAGLGHVFTTTGTNPAANTEISETVPTGARWELLHFAAVLTTNATVADRRPKIRFIQNGVQAFVSPAPATIPASTVRGLGWAQGLPLAVAFSTERLLAGLVTPSLLFAGNQIQTTTTAMQATDDYDAPVYTVREWLTADA